MFSTLLTLSLLRFLLVDMSLAMAHEKTRAVSSPDRQYKTMISNISRAINTSPLLIEPDDTTVKRKFVMVAAAVM